MKRSQPQLAVGTPILGDRASDSNRLEHAAILGARITGEVSGLVRSTVFLTTHYREETEEADLVSIIDEGRIIAQGTPAELRAKHSHSILTARLCNRWLRSSLFRQPAEAVAK